MAKYLIEAAISLKTLFDNNKTLEITAGTIASPALFPLEELRFFSQHFSQYFCHPNAYYYTTSTPILDTFHLSLLGSVSQQNNL